MLDNYGKPNGIAMLTALGIALTSAIPALAEPNVLPGPVSSAAALVPLPGIYTPPAGLQHLGGERGSWSYFPLRSASPIFMTSINYPGVYGAYYYGAAPGAWSPGLSDSPYTLRPSWTTLPPPWATPPMEPVPVVRTRLVPPATDVRGAPATITIFTPEPASVWVEGQPLPGFGTENHFTTPSLRPNQLYSYEITAMWSQDGVPVKDTRTTVVQSGERHLVGFHRKPLVNGNSSPGTRVPD
jgi:uncharacterized protein (TIGR03000 family)